MRWWLEAAAGDGPEVPVTPALVLAQRLADGTLPVIGAMPCVGLLDLDSLMAALAPFAVRSGVEGLP